MIKHWYLFYFNLPFYPLGDYLLVLAMTFTISRIYFIYLFIIMFISSQITEYKVIGL